MILKEAVKEGLLDKNPSENIKGFKVETGEFGAMMEVALVNDGPVTFILESL